MSSQCPDAGGLRRLLAGQLAQAEAEAVEAHVGACAACQQALERLTPATLPPAAVAGAPDADFLRRLAEWMPSEAGLAGLSTAPPPSHPAGQVTVAHAGGRGDQASTEVQALLRKRLL